ncbi:MAG TPA: flagellar export protein FliJ [Thermoleophilaceae bacterium]
MDRPFTFKLERVRALRERKEDLAKEELAASLALRLRGEAMLQAAVESVEQARGAQRGGSGAPMTAQDLQAAQAYLERTEREHEFASLNLDRQDAEVDMRRSALQNAARERQVLERLKERRRTEHRREADRREGVLLDEMAITMHRRRGAQAA